MKPVSTDLIHTELILAYIDEVIHLRAENARLIEERYVEGWNDAIANSEAVTDLRAENAKLKAEMEELRKSKMGRLAWYKMRDEEERAARGETE